ncbi:MAG: hypothetical protein IJT27_03085 [Clostridia bacterium]|nr:hypothetical protein [Clostridia bacterium]
MQDYESNVSPEQDTPKKKNRTGFFVVGLLIIALAAFGLVQLALLGVQSVKEASREKQQALLAAYNTYLIPAAAIDIEPFDDITSAKMEELVEMSVWSVLNAAADPTEYEYENGELRLPAAEVEAAYQSFFGSEVPINHCTVSGYGYEFAYDAATNAYQIPLTTITPLYTPQFVSAEEKGDVTILTCGLVNAGLYTQDPVSGELQVPAPDKYIKVTLRIGPGGRYIRAIQSSAAPETAAIGK